MRIASLVPSTTEMVAALGRSGDLVARTHECDHPPEVLEVAAVTADHLPPGLDPGEIDAAVAASVGDRHTIYALDAEALASTAPEVILTQSTCSVCAVDRPAVDAVACTMPHGAKVISFDPTSLDEITTGAVTIGEAIGADREGHALESHLEARLDWLARRLASPPRPRVAVVEWPDPVYAPGHWVPDMVDAAGGISVFGDAAVPSQRATIGDLVATGPDVVVMAFCGYDLAKTVELTDALLETATWIRSGLGDARLAAFDGSAYFSRPGPRVLDGIEAMAWLLHAPHPDLRPVPGVGAVRSEGGWVDLAESAAPLRDAEPATVSLHLG